jgi:PPOX class probable F420-dependent enzyme
MAEMELPASTPIPGPILAFLRAPRLATLSTIDRDGAPHQAVIWYAIDGDSMLINSRVGRRWPENLRRDPRLAIAVNDTERRYHWVGVKGRAEVVRSGPDAVADIVAMAHHYDGDPDAFAGQDRVTFRVIAESVFEYED